MREILFRGKRTDNGEWVYGAYCKHDTVKICFSTDDAKTKHLIIVDGFCDWGFEPPLAGYEVIPETVGQFTGLLDKNGTMIFEGDIVLSQEYGTHDYSKKKKVKRFEGVVYYYVGSGTGFCNKETGEWNDRRDYSAEWRVRIDDKERHSKYRHGVWGDFYDCEVIGNIHEQGVQ